MIGLFLTSFKDAVYGCVYQLGYQLLTSLLTSLIIPTIAKLPRDETTLMPCSQESK
jgi:hypothetical protein